MNRIGSGRTARAGCSKREGGPRWRQYSQLAKGISIDFQNGDVDDDFRFCLIDILNNLFCNRDSIRCVSHDDGVHRGALRQIPHVEQRPERRNRFRDFRRGNAVAQIDRFQNEFIVVAALGLVVAVPAVWLFNYFTGKVDGFVVEMDNSASELVDYFIKNRTKQLTP